MNHQIQPAEAARYPEQPLPIDPYVLGIWLGDGTGISARLVVTVGRGDEHILEEIIRAGYAVWPSSGERACLIGGLSRPWISAAYVMSWRVNSRSTVPYSANLRRSDCSATSTFLKCVPARIHRPAARTSPGFPWTPVGT